MKQPKTERDAVNDLMLNRKQKLKAQGPEEPQWEWTGVCGKIVDLGDGKKALMYIGVKRKGCKVLIEQEVANNDGKDEGTQWRAQNVKIVQRKHYFNEILAEQFAKNVLQRFLNDGCFPLTDASSQSSM